MLVCTVLVVLSGLQFGVPYEHLFEFPPVSTRIDHQPTSLWLVVLGLLFIATCCIVLFERVMDSLDHQCTLPPVVAAFPIWGYFSLVLMLASWVTAWGFASEENTLRFFTFSGIWFGYIFFANALCICLSGTAPFHRRPMAYLLLFPVSALFWWSFEYINRVVENWAYIELGTISPLGYIVLASFSFATVLPAVHVSKELCELLLERLTLISTSCAIPMLQDRVFWWCLLLGSLIPLILLVHYPTELYPMVWLAPAFAVPAFQQICAQRHVYSDLIHGDSRSLICWSGGGLLCGFLWEMWNFYSAPKWVYHVSYVDVFHVFEMPLLGYLGYIPFGWLCGTVVIAFFSDAREGAEPKPLPGKAPQHVAIIMDGNGRWARARGLPRLQGHAAGIQRVQQIIEWSKRLGVRYVTLYAFSTENWSRPQAEVDGLFRLMERYLRTEQEKLVENNIRLRVVGDRSRLSPVLQELIADCEALTENCDSLDAILAISYGSRHEIDSALRTVADRVARGEVTPEELDSLEIRRFLYSPDVPDPDLLIRTGGERRLSNFLLWQAAYSELLFIPEYWPDFDELLYRSCLLDFLKRNRRYGALPNHQNGKADARLHSYSALTPDAPSV